MSRFHDAYARFTPFELALPGAAFVRERFGAVRDEVRTSALPGAEDDPQAFQLVGQVGRLLRELRPPDAAADEAPHLAVLLFHAYHLWFGARRVELLEEPLVRALTGVGAAGAGEAGGSARAVEAPEADAPDAGVEARAASTEAAPATEPADRAGAAAPWPADSGYVQLPRSLVWVKPGGEGAAAEAVDGLFVTARAGLVHGVVVSGVLEGRAGFSVLPLPAVPDGALRALAREGAPLDAFRATMPGAELDALVALTTAEAAWTLMARFAEAAATGRAVAEEGTPPSDADPAGPRPSVLPFRRWRTAGGRP